MAQNAKYTPSEHDEQETFIQWAEYFLSADLRPLLYAIPNGGHRNKAVAGKLKAEGVRPGVPDLFFAHPRHGYHGLYIEMKQQRGGRLSDAQKNMITRLQGEGYQVEVCAGCSAAMDVMQEYMQDDSQFSTMVTPEEKAFLSNSRPPDMDIKTASMKLMEDAT